MGVDGEYLAAFDQYFRKGAEALRRLTLIAKPGLIPVPGRSASFRPDGSILVVVREVDGDGFLVERGNLILPSENQDKR
jgi:hypothetical protein